MNYSKPDSMFNFGMKVSCYSEKKAQDEKISWHRTGENIKYFMNGVKKDPEYPHSQGYFTLTFTHTFEYDNDIVLFAYSVPYSYSNLR